MKKMAKNFFLILFLIFAGIPLPALTIKLASFLPEGSEWDKSLRLMADEWRVITNGQVRIRIYPGGVAGNEADMIRKMRFGQLDAGVFTAFGLKSIVPETFVITLPGMIREESELDHILDNWVDQFDVHFQEAGFEMMAWSKTGWAYFFCEQPIRDPNDLKRLILAVDDTETQMAATFKALGFKVAPVSMAEITVSLQSGLAHAIYAPPVAAAAFQWFALTPYMMQYRLAPVVGGLILSQRSWSKIPKEYHEALKISMDRVAQSFYEESIQINSEALSIMEKNGLVQVQINQEQKEAWEEVMASGHELIVGDEKDIPLELYNSLKMELEALRQGQ